jgi:hypothetical protein
VLHPELSFEDDVRDLLKVNEKLARLLQEDQEAGLAPVWWRGEDFRSRYLI